jgi:hypothetical protein
LFLNNGEKLRAYFRPGGKVDGATDSDLKDFMGSISAIAHDHNGKSSIEAAYFENKKRKLKRQLCSPLVKLESH